MEDRRGTGILLHHLSVPASSPYQVHFALLGMELHGEDWGILPALQGQLFCSQLYCKQTNKKTNLQLDKERVSCVETDSGDDRVVVER